MILNDLVPFVAEHIYSVNQKVTHILIQLQKAVKAVVNRLEAISGEDLKDYIQAQARN